MIDQETIQRIMDATRIEEVVGEFVSLKKRGANHIGCCPFHNEKTPSFYVSPGKGIFKCFGCGKSGNAVGFLMDHEHYTYPEALRYLAKKYNIEIQEEEQTEEQKERQTQRDALFHVSEYAQKQWADYLYNDEMGAAVGLSYFHNRGLSDEVIKEFGLGYCLDEWDGFTKVAMHDGYSEEILVQSGLTIKKEETGKLYDRFRGRVTFPIYSVSGRVLGFSCRILSSEKQAAKYVNSPESEIYHKSNCLYGLFQARNTITREDKCYLVEGNVDVISMHQSGVKNTVASCGTSLTPEQVQLIKRYTKNITVVYDGDNAGIKATLKAVKLIFAAGMRVRMVLFPDQEDPDSYAQKYGSSKLQEYLATHEENYIAYRMRIEQGDVLNDPIRKVDLEREILDTLAVMQDPLERSEYLSLTASRLRVNADELSHELQRILSANRQAAWKEENKQLQQAARQAAAQPAATPAAEPGQPSVQPSAPSEFDPFDPTNEEEYRPSDPYRSEPQTLADKNPCEPQERKLISLLINSGDKIISYTSGGSEEPETKLASVAQIIVSNIVNDEIAFDNPLYQKIFDLYANAVNEGTSMPDANYFATQSDPILRNTALSMIMEHGTHSISELWSTKKLVPVPSVEGILPNDVNESILTFKLKKVNCWIEENNRKLRDCHDDEAILELMLEQKQLLDIRTLVSKELYPNN